VVPQFAGLGPTLSRLRAGNLWWLGLGVVVEAASIAGDIVLLRGVVARPGSRIGWKASYQITLAGTAATKLFATAGAGGIALTVWALRASGRSEVEVATRLVCFEILEYGVYMRPWRSSASGCATAFSRDRHHRRHADPGTVRPAVILIVLSVLLAEAPVERFLTARADRSRGRRHRWWCRAAAVPHSLRLGLMAAIAMVRRRDPSLLGALAGWVFDIAALWASFRAFGHSPPAAVLVMG
jgi:putative heme transporter